jgi:hypothetical protein
MAPGSYHHLPARNSQRWVDQSSTLASRVSEVQANVHHAAVKTKVIREAGEAIIGSLVWARQEAEASE